MSGRQRAIPVPQACRRAMLGAADAEPAARRHVRDCALCTRRLAVHEGLQALLAQRPAGLTAAQSSAALQGIYERVVTAAEESPLGAAAGAVFAATLAAGPPPLEAPVPMLEPSLVEGLLNPPPRPSAGHWTRLRHALLSDLLASKHVGVDRAGVDRASTSASVRRARLRWFAVVAAAAAAAVVLMTFDFPMTAEGTKAAPAIVFIDLDRAPDLDFAMVRYGSRG